MGMRLFVYTVASILFAFAWMIVASVASVQAQEYARNVALKAVAVDNYLSTRGFDQSHERHIASLRSGQTDSVVFNLRANATYYIAAVCDADCSDLDLYAYDENRNLVEQDEKSDAIPMVSIRPRWTGRFTMRVKMHQCRRNPCFFAMTIYQRK